MLTGFGFSKFLGAARELVFAQVLLPFSRATVWIIVFVIHQPLRTVVFAFLWCGLIAEVSAQKKFAYDPLALLQIRDDPARHLTLRWQGTIRAEAGRPGSWIERFIENRFNLTLEPRFIVFFSYPRVLPLRMLGGDIADVTWIMARDVAPFSRHGFALELPWEVIRRHAPNYVRLLNANAPEMWLLTHNEGRNYGVPLSTIESRFPRPGIWRMDWLRNVGIDRVPATLVEMEEALRRFRYRDPDRNGKIDTYGMSTWRSPMAPDTMDRSFEEIFGAHGVLTTGWMERNGKIVWGGVLPEAKETLGVLQRWYAEGLIYPDYAVAPAGSIDLIKKLTSGMVGYLSGLAEYFSFDLSNNQSMAAVVASVQSGGEIVPALFPRGPEGKRGGRGVSFGESLGVLMFGRHLEHEPEKVVRVLRMLDEFAADAELFLTVRLGKQGHHWQWDEAKGLHPLPPFDLSNNAARELIHRTLEPWRTWGFYSLFGGTQAIADLFRTAPHRAFDDAYRNSADAIYDALGQAEAVPADLILGDLIQFQVTTYSEIIGGRLPLSHFDHFVREWHHRGGAQLTGEANDLFARRRWILDRAGVPPPVTP